MLNFHYRAILHEKNSNRICNLNFTNKARYHSLGNFVLRNTPLRFFMHIPSLQQNLLKGGNLPPPPP